MVITGEVDVNEMESNEFGIVCRVRRRIYENSEKNRVSGECRYLRNGIIRMLAPRDSLQHETGSERLNTLTLFSLFLFFFSCVQLLRAKTQSLL